MTNAPKSHITVDVPGLPTAHMELTTGETVEAVLSYAAQKWGEALAAGEAEPQQDSPADVLRSLFDAIDDGLLDDEDDDEDEDDELEDAPTFAKGDRVKLVDDDVTNAKHVVGDLGTVLSQYDFFSSTVVDVQFDGKDVQTVYAPNIEHVGEGDGLAEWERELLASPTVADDGEIVDAEIVEEPKPFAEGDRVVLVTKDPCSEARVGSLGTVRYAYPGGDLSVDFDGWRNQIMYASGLRRVLVKSPEKGDRVVRTGNHVIFGTDYDGKESTVGMTGEVYRDAYEPGDSSIGVKWDKPLDHAYAVSSSSIRMSSLTVIE